MMDDSERRKIMEKAKKSRVVANDSAEQIDFVMVRFDGENAAIDFNVDWSHDTVWASQRQMAELFGKDPDTVGHHIATLFSSGEFAREATTAKFAVVRLEGGREVTREIEHYNLDVILTVGYRVSSAKAVEFRKWANNILKSYLVQGYALNERRLANDTVALQNLAAQVRALRAEEKNIYSAVRETFKVSASDYASASPAAKSFFARVQDRFLYAATGKTAASLILERADAAKPNMGLTVVKGRYPTKAECTVGKNYLFSDELYVLHIMCEQFLLFAESKALRGQQATMAELATKLDQLMAINEYPVFPGYGDFLRDKAKDHAEIEWHRLMDDISSGRHLPAA